MRIAILAAVLWMGAMGSALAQTSRMYLVPKVQIALPGTAATIATIKYRAEFMAFKAPYVQHDYGLEPIFLVMITLSDLQDASITKNKDVIPVPDRAATAADVSLLRSFAIPIAVGDNLREVALWVFTTMQVYQGKGQNPIRNRPPGQTEDQALAALLQEAKAKK